MTDRAKPLEFTLEKLSSGYVMFRASSELWAQWPPWERNGPLREDCFHPSWSWPIIRDAWAHGARAMHAEARR